jgi:alanine racemase
VKSWVEISENRLKANYRTLVEAAGCEPVLAVVKANAYGHGADLCAPVLARAGAEWLGIADAVEGADIREALIAAGTAHECQPRILVMSGFLNEDAEAIVRHGMTPVVWDQQHMENLAAAVRQRGGCATPFPIHLEIDTGMARQGIAPGEHLHTLLYWLKRQPLLRLDGVMTHFAASEVAGSQQTKSQRKLYEEAIAAVAAAGFEPTWVHAGNSSMLDNQCSDNQDTENNLSWLRALAASVGARPMVRAGIALYGYCLPIEQPSSASDAVQAKVRHRLEPLMTWKTRVIGTRELQHGDAVGYNGIFVAQRPTRIALLPIGYSDGLRRELSGTNAKPGAWVILHGQRAPIVGRISMNLTTIDVTDIPHAAVGDEVILLGDGITADDHSHLAHTISYEILCGIRAAQHLVA